jgi:putative ABC transport system permease protein
MSNMNMIWKTAWKNVWRNKVRSFVVISSVAVGVFAGIFAVALMNGMIAQRVNDALNEEVAHIQINCKNFRINNDPHLVVANPGELITELKSTSEISGFSMRTVITGMANTAGKSAGVQIIGIDPDQDQKIITISSEIIPGTGGYFEKETKFSN